MARNGRQLLYTAERVHALVASMEATYRAAHFETMVELKRLQVEVAELRDLMAQMRAARLAVVSAERELAELNDMRRAMVERQDPATSLH